MKTIIIAITLLTLAALPVQAQKQTKKAKKSETTAIATIELNSVKCSMCASVITGALSELEGVKNVEIDVDEQTAKVTYVPKKVTESTLESAIAKAGYNANDVERDDKAYKELPGCCK